MRRVALEPCAMCAHEQLCNFTEQRAALAFKVGVSGFTASVPLCHAHIADVANAAGSHIVDVANASTVKRGGGVIMLRIDDIRRAVAHGAARRRAELYQGPDVGEVTRMDSGEVMAIVPLGAWQEIVKLADAIVPCMPECGAPGCRLARMIEVIEECRVRGE